MRRRTKALQSGVDQDQIIRRLAQAEEHAVLGAENIRRQRKLVGDMARKGLPTAQARQILDTLEDVQATFVADRNRLRALLVEKSN